MTGHQFLNDLITGFLPECVLGVFILGLILFGALRGEGSARWVFILSAVTIGVVIGVIGCSQTFSGAFFNDLVISNPLTVYGKLLASVSALIALVLAQRYLMDQHAHRFEFPILILLSLLGMMILMSAANFLTLYVGFELQSLSLYILASFRRDSVKSAEAGLKYFVLGALASCLILYGISLIYGFTGTISFDSLAHLFAGADRMAGTLPLGMTFGLAFVCAGLAFKVSAAPFHMWTPDVYQGAATPVTAFFATAPKVAAILVFARILMGPFGGLITAWQPIVLAMAALSMVVGAFAALMQSNLKRLMAYSTIGHIGFILIGLAAGTREGLSGVLVYLSLYVFMTAGVFAILLCLKQKGEYKEEITDLRGLSKTRPILALSMAILMFSLAGIPPTAGFFAKLAPMIAALDVHLVWIVVFGVVTSVVSAYYYLRIIKVMYFDEAPKEIDPSMPVIAWDKNIPAEWYIVIAVSIAVTLGFIVAPRLLVDKVGNIAASSFATEQQ